MVKVYGFAITGNIKYLHSRVLLKPMTSLFYYLIHIKHCVSRITRFKDYQKDIYPCFKLGIQSFHFMKAHEVNFSKVLESGKKVCLSLDQLFIVISNWFIVITIKPSILVNLLHCSGILFSLSITSYLFPNLLISVLCYSMYFLYDASNSLWNNASINK